MSLQTVFSHFVGDSSFDRKVQDDRQLRSVIKLTFNVRFSYQVEDAQDSLFVNIEQGRVTVGEKQVCDDTHFTLSASKEVWDKFFVVQPELGFQSFWAMYLPQNQVVPATAQVIGDHLKFAQYAPVWRRILEIIHEVELGGSVAGPEPPIPDEDHIVGRYALLDLPKWGGKCKGNQDILFLHTAGSDGRQYHDVMNDARLLKRDLRMTIFDLPSHGRSFPPFSAFNGSHHNSEDRYIEIISAIIKHLDLKKVVVCGASMAGLICLGIALRNDEVGAFATIPVQGCEYVDMDRMHWDQHPEVNQSLLVPEFTYGMMSPTAPMRNKSLVWHIYSAQAYRQYAGDLDFYFGGFDHRGRLETIDTAKIPVAMLTGEYDWSCRPEMSLETAAKIKGAWIKIMKGLGHFPATENPEVFASYLLEALDHVNGQEQA